MLLKEIELVTEFPLADFTNMMVIHYLMHIRSKRAISKESIVKFADHKSFYLTQKIGKLKETEIYGFCHELAKMRSSNYASIDGKTLYSFLDNVLDSSKKRKELKTGPIPAHLLA